MTADETNDGEEVPVLEPILEPIEDEEEPKGKATTPPKSKVGKNPMRTIDLHKLVINIGVGEAGEKLLKAEKVIDLLTHHKPVRTISKTTNKDLGLRLEMPIGCKVTLRGQDAKDFLKKAFWIKENRIAHYSFDPEGNFSFGISEYTDFPDMRYDPDIGVFGMDISVRLARPGLRITQRRRGCKALPKSHRITKSEAYDYLKDQFNIEVVEE
ncbi:MAG: 50S ribosomal protein L5 [Deltaproteobacteria bacterium]|nr:50S ribosomal protein L5 [Deltaproteobacteria bacterium]